MRSVSTLLQIYVPYTCMRKQKLKQSEYPSFANQSFSVTRHTYNPNNILKRTWSARPNCTLRPARRPLLFFFRRPSSSKLQPVRSWLLSDLLLHSLYSMSIADLFLFLGLFFDRVSFTSLVSSLYSFARLVSVCNMDSCKAASEFSVSCCFSNAI